MLIEIHGGVTEQKTTLGLENIVVMEMEQAYGLYLDMVIAERKLQLRKWFKTGH